MTPSLKIDDTKVKWRVNEELKIAHVLLLDSGVCLTLEQQNNCVYDDDTLYIFSTPEKTEPQVFTMSKNEGALVAHLLFLLKSDELHAHEPPEPPPKRQKRTIVIDVPDSAIFIEKLPEKSESDFIATVFYEVHETEGGKCNLVCYVRQNYQDKITDAKAAWDFLCDTVEEIIDSGINTSTHFFELDEVFKPSTMQMDDVFLRSPDLSLGHLDDFSLVRFIIPIVKNAFEK